LQILIRIDGVLVETRTRDLRDTKYDCYLLDREIWKTHVMWRPELDNMNNVSTNDAANDTVYHRHEYYSWFGVAQPL
jgi:hypothetical protein